MAGFGTTVGRPIYGRGPSPGLRFTVYAILSLVLMYLDQRARWSERLRYGLEAAAYPVRSRNYLASTFTDAARFTRFGISIRWRGAPLDDYAINGLLRGRSGIAGQGSQSQGQQRA